MRDEQLLATFFPVQRRSCVVLVSVVGFRQLEAGGGVAVGVAVPVGLSLEVGKGQKVRLVVTPTSESETTLSSLKMNLRFFCTGSSKLFRYVTLTMSPITQTLVHQP